MLGNISCHQIYTPALLQARPHVSFTEVQSHAACAVLELLSTRSRGHFGTPPYTAAGQLLLSSISRRLNFEKGVGLCPNKNLLQKPSIKADKCLVDMLIVHYP